MRKTIACAVLALGAGLALTPAAAQKAYGPGVTDTEIKIGNTNAYSGPASAYSLMAKVQAAYFKMLNENGGINGRKINFVSYDDAYSPPKTVEQTRKLVEGDEVLLVFNPLGTAPNSATQKYFNARKVPQLFVGTGAHKWNDPKNFPWTMGWQPSYHAEGMIYAKYILANKPAAKIAILYQNDDFGKDYLKGMLDGLEGKIKPVLQLPYEVTDPTIEAQVARLASSGADVFFDIASPKFAAQAIKKAAELNWKPMHILVNTSISVGAVLKPAGFEAAQGIISTAYQKDALDPQWKDDAGYKKWLAFVDKYVPDVDRSQIHLVYGYNTAQTLEHVLKMCGDNLTRENVMKQAASIKDLQLDMVLPGIKVNTSAERFAPINQERMQTFKGDRWELFGPVYEAGVATH